MYECMRTQCTIECWLNCVLKRGECTMHAAHCHNVYTLNKWMKYFIYTQFHGKGINLEICLHFALPLVHIQYHCAIHSVCKIYKWGAKMRTKCSHVIVIYPIYITYSCRANNENVENLQRDKNSLSFILKVIFQWKSH